MAKETEDKKTKVEKKVAPTKKKVEPKVEKEQKATVETTPVRQKRKDIDANELVSCRSTTHGNLIYISKRTGEQFFWYDFGTTLDIPYGELKALNATAPEFIKDVLFVIDDEEAVEALGLKKMYDQLFDIEDIESLFNMKYEELEVTLDKLPKGLKDSVATKALEMVKTGEFDSRSKIKLIEEKLQIELTLLAD